MSRTIPLLVAAALAASFIAPASAQTLNQRQRETVHYGDLDLYNTKDAGIMLDRIDAAAERVCTDSGYPSTRAEREYASNCVDSSTNRAVRQVDNPLVTAMNDGLTPEVIIEGDAAYPDDK